MCEWINDLASQHLSLVQASWGWNEREPVVGDVTSPGNVPEVCSRKLEPRQTVSWWPSRQPSQSTGNIGGPQIRKAILSCLDLNLILAWNSSKRPWLYQLLFAFGIERAVCCLANHCLTSHRPFFAAFGHTSHSYYHSFYLFCLCRSVAHLFICLMNHSDELHCPL